MKFYLFIIFFLVSLQSRAQKRDSATLVLHSSNVGRSELFNYIGSAPASSLLSFNNPTHNDTTILRKIAISKPTHLFYEELVITSSSAPAIEKFGSLLLFPGDSIVLGDRGGKVLFSTGYKNFIDSLINIRELYLRNLPKLAKKIENNGLDKILKGIQEKYLSNETLINSLSNKSGSHKKRIEALLNFNYIVRCSRVWDILLAIEKNNLDNWKRLEPIFEEMEQNFNKIEAIKSPFSFGILYGICSFEALKQSKPINNIWDFFDSPGKRITNSKFYRSFLLLNINNSYNGNIKELKKTISLIKESGIEDPQFDSLLQNKIRMQAKANSETTGSMQNMKGKLSNYSSLIKSLKGNYVFVDFWATWCVPCRAQIPFLNKAIPKFKNSNIKFVSVSIDDDEAEAEWISASRDTHKDADSLNFRLQKGHYNKLLKFLNMTTVPRYILYDTEGNVVTSHFITPDKKGFAEELKKAITRQKE